MKKPTDDVRSLQQGAKCPQRPGFHVGKGENAGAAEPVRFDFPPDPFAGIQLRTIPREQIQAQLTFVALYPLGHTLVNFTSKPIAAFLKRDEKKKEVSRYTRDLTPQPSSR